MQASPQLLQAIFELVVKASYSRLDDSTQERQLTARVMLTAERQIPGLPSQFQTIKVSSVT